MYPSRDVTFISLLMNSFVLYVKRSIAKCLTSYPMWEEWPSSSNRTGLAGGNAGRNWLFNQSTNPSVVIHPLCERENHVPNAPQTLFQPAVLRPYRQHGREQLARSRNACLYSYVLSSQPRYESLRSFLSSSGKDGFRSPTQWKA